MESGGDMARFSFSSPYLDGMSLPPPSRVGTPLQPTCNINKPLPPRPLRRIPHGVQLSPRYSDSGYGVPSSSKQPPPRQSSYDEHDPLALSGWFGGNSVPPKPREAPTIHPIFDSPTPTSLKRTSAPNSVFAIAQRNARRITDEDRRAYRNSSHNPSPPPSPSLSYRDLTYRRRSRSESDDEPLRPSTPPRSPRLTSKLPHVDVCEPDVWLKTVQLQKHSDYDPGSGRYLHRGTVRSARCYGDSGGLREAPALQRVSSQRAVVSRGTGRLR